jgi:hypothetical protein
VPTSPERRAHRETVEPVPYWFFVRGLPVTKSERFLHEKLERRNIQVSDVFMNTDKMEGSGRFAYVGVYDERDLEDAVRAFRGLDVEGRVLNAGVYVDSSTQARIPHQVVNSDPSRRYFGAKAQARMPPDPARVALFLLHVPVQATEQDVSAFVRRSLPARNVGTVVVKYHGFGTRASVELLGPLEEVARAGDQAIRQLDGEVLCGQALRVTWRSIDPVWLARTWPEARTRTSFN